nr:adenosylcobinamide-GDP ribazoletransferase [Acinetobacter sp. Marseille-Q1620]
MTAFLIALQFLTTFPVYLKHLPTPQQNAQSLLFYPLIGLLIGIILYAFATILSILPAILLATLILVIWIWLTGGLHLDGLADTADAWVGGFGDKERTLKIMKDPSCGPIGVLGLIIICILKWSAIYILVEQKQCVVLVLFPMLGRLSPLFLFLTTHYVRENGLGTSIAEYIPKKSAIFVLIIGFLLCLSFSLAGVIVAVITLIILFYLRHKFIARIGGITGDTVGASIEIIETLSIFCFVLILCLA